MEKLSEPDLRENNTAKELGKWLEIYPEDISLHQEAGFITDVVSEWKLTGNEAVALHKLWRRYYQTEGSISEVATVVLNQSTMWFSYEADASHDLDWQIMNEESVKHHQNY